MRHERRCVMKRGAQRLIKTYVFARRIISIMVFYSHFPPDATPCNPKPDVSDWKKLGWVTTHKFRRAGLGSIFTRVNCKCTANTYSTSLTIWKSVSFLLQITTVAPSPPFGSVCFCKLVEAKSRLKDWKHWLFMDPTIRNDLRTYRMG